MKTNIIAPSGTCRLDVRASERGSFTEYHVTATLTGSAGLGASVDDLLTLVAETLVAHRIQPVQEKCYGLSRVRDEVLSRRDMIYRLHGLDRTMPVTWVEGTPLLAGDFAGVQIWGVVPRDGEPCVETVKDPVVGRARLWSGDGFRVLHLPSVSGTTPDGRLAPDRSGQAGWMFRNVESGLAAHDMRYTDVVRTWIYVARLLDWYGEMNRVRTVHYNAAGIGVNGGPAFPASTGIMGHSAGEECMMDVLAIQNLREGSVVATPINRSAKQDSSFNYGSSFSRGMALEIEGRRTVHISGTASINTAGESTHVGDAEHQCIDTLLSIAAILEEQGGGLKDITSATLFCKDRAAHEAWRRTIRMLQIPPIPHVCVLADVCRHDLLVEMEAVAFIEPT